jgi:hypothetical protein
MISKKLKIMKRLTAHLQGMTPAWSANLPTFGEVACPYTMTNSVFRGRSVFGEDVLAPSISILEAPRQFNPNDVGDAKLTQNEDWALLIQGFADEDQKNPLDPAYDLLAWTQARMMRLTATKPNGSLGGLYPDEYMLGGLITKIGYQIPVVRPGKDDVSDTAYFYLPVVLGVVSNLAEPFVEGD